MILEKLVAYYQRELNAPNSSLAPFGFQRKRLDFLIVLDPSGRCLALETSKNLAPGFHSSYLLPSEVKRSRQIEANFLWDNASYVLGLGRGGEEDFRDLWQLFLSKAFDPEAMPPRVHNFWTKVRSAADAIDDVGLQAICRFYEHKHVGAFLERYGDGIRGSSPISFRLAEDAFPIACRPRVALAIPGNAEAGTRIRCSVSGEIDELAELHPTIKGLKGALATGAKLVSFNQESARFFSKDQGANAPIGRRSAFAYSEALNHMLRPRSGHLVTIADLSLLFWSDSDASWESAFQSSLAFSGGQRTLNAFVDDLFADRWAKGEGDFCLLGLSAQKSRIAVRSWLCAPVELWARRMKQFYADLAIAHAPYEAEHLSLYAVGAAMAPEKTIGDVESRCMIELLEAIFNGEAYPHSIFYIIMNHIRKEKDIGYQRASLIKAYLVRLARCPPRTESEGTRSRFNQVQEEVGVALDRAYANVGYCLGRLFAVLEKLQEESNQGLFSNVRERYYITASTAPAAAFPLLLRQKNSYLGRIANPMKRENFEQEISGIVMNIKEIPKNLHLADQGRFAIGYYHQRQDFFQTHGE